MNLLILTKNIIEKCRIFFKNPSPTWRLLDKESSVMLLTSLIVGVCAGLGAVIFRHLIDWIQNFAYEDLAGILSDWHPFHLILIPALGGAIVGPLVYYLAREAKDMVFRKLWNHWNSVEEKLGLG